jgi:hypothetical protein
MSASSMCNPLADVIVIQADYGLVAISVYASTSVRVWFERSANCSKACSDSS